MPSSRAPAIVTRVHFAVICANLGCPNLAPRAYTADNLEELYETGARAFINHPRGAELQGSQLWLSSIFSWFKEDFGGDPAARLLWLNQFAEPPLAETLRSWKGRVSYDCDWSLNAPGPGPGDYPAGGTTLHD